MAGGEGAEGGLWLLHSISCISSLCTGGADDGESREVRGVSHVDDIPETWGGQHWEWRCSSLSSSFSSFFTASTLTLLVSVRGTSGLCDFKGAAEHKDIHKVEDEKEGATKREGTEGSPIEMSVGGEEVMPLLFLLRLLSPCESHESSPGVPEEMGMDEK